MRRTRVPLGFILALALVLPVGAAGAITGPPGGGAVTVGQHWTLELFYPNGQPSLCMRETIEANNQFAFPPHQIWTNGSYKWYPRTSESSATMNETWFDGFLNTEDSFDGTWTPSIKGFVGTASQGGAIPAQLVKGTHHVWEGVQCETT